MDLGIDGKVALVTGGSSGIGRACAIELAREGAQVCIVGRNRERLDETLERLREAGRDGLAVAADLSTAEGCRRAHEACLEGLGTVDILVNSAGAAQAAPVLGLDASLIDEALGLKLYSALRLSQLVVPAMKAKGWGRIVNIAGAAGSSPTAENLPVSFANVTMLNLTKGLSDAVAGHGILVNVICPGGTDTPRAHVRWQAEARRTGKSMQEIKSEAGLPLPARRVAEAEEVARVACFLASAACSYVFASAIYMDGGARQATP